MASNALLPFARTAEENPAYTVNRTAEQINYIEVVANGVTYRQTWTYTGDYVTAISAWVKQ
jgi:hypothetical protein